MSLDLSAAGYRSSPHSFTYDWKTVVLYALGIGATRDELPYLYESKGPKVYPSFAVIPVFMALGDALAKTGGNLASVVHGGQIIRLHRPIPSEGTLETVATIEGIYDLRKMAQAVVKTTSTMNGEPCFETEWSILFRGEGGFGGDPPPKTETPSAAGAAQESVEQITSPEQALLYRLSGDLNPLHADPDFAALVGFPQGPILHGLCTYGYVARAVIQKYAGGDGDKLTELGVQFRKPVWPGEAIRTDMSRVDPSTIALSAYAGGRPDAVITNAWAKLSS
ncbi:MAG: MaoC family dehydratase N-terminal domain-containing protein [Polyangiaceae bacterium]|nr:MaoC family dehydratase N-terminal domain-containing protein [Polyangiaceae bacterium]